MNIFAGAVSVAGKMMSIAEERIDELTLENAQLKGRIQFLERMIDGRQKTKAELANFLIGMCDNADKVKEMSNKELAENLRRAVGDHLPMNELAYELIDQAAERLEEL